MTAHRRATKFGSQHINSVKIDARRVKAKEEDFLTTNA